MHWNLNLFALHRGGLTLLDGTLSYDFLPSLFTLRGTTDAAALKHCATTKAATGTDGLLSWAARFQLLFLIMVVHSFAGLMIFLLVAAAAADRGVVVAIATVECS